MVKALQYTGKWDYVQPTPVKITVDAFIEKSHWFDLVEGQFIQGLVAYEEFMGLL